METLALPMDATPRPDVPPHPLLATMEMHVLPMVAVLSQDALLLR